MAQAANLPFKTQEVINLTQKGLDAANFKMGLLTFESQKYICVKEGAVSFAYDLGAKSRLTLQTLRILTLIFFYFVYSKLPSLTPPMASTSSAVT